MIDLEMIVHNMKIDLRDIEIRKIGLDRSIILITKSGR